MNADQTIIQDPSLLSPEELIEEYERLSRFYTSAKETCDINAQTIYELKRSLKTATNAEEYLSNELDVITAVHTTEIEKVHSKYAVELEENKTKVADLKNSNNLLEIELEDVKSLVETLRQRISEQVVVPIETKTEVPCNIDKELRLEAENQELLAVINELRINAMSSERHSETLQSQIDELKEKLECTEENLVAKKLELEEKTQMLESTHEAMSELNAELAIFKCDPGNESESVAEVFVVVLNILFKIAREIPCLPRWMINDNR